jgi:dTDP-4-dehydrorhamnose 3,5-epimerase
MIFTPTAVAGAFVVEVERYPDERGWFGRTYSFDEFAAHGVPWRVEQCSFSFNRQSGTLRGLHYQEHPHEEPKLVHCTQGRIFDVAVDLRPASPSYRRWVGQVLDPDRANALFVPAGCAHGFLTLVDGSQVSYAIGAPYVPEAGRGVRWDDPAFAIEWPAVPAVISERDAGYPDFDG